MVSDTVQTNSSDARVILFMGAPGSGKGTQSSWLSSHLAMPCLSTGEVLRAEANRPTPAGFALQRVLASGALVDDRTVCSVVSARLRRDAANSALRGGLILDGFPRTEQQAVFLQDLLAGLGLPQPTVIYLEVSAEGLLNRLTARRQCPDCDAIYNLISRPSRRGALCENDGRALVQREDDREDVILRRLDAFHSSAAPLFSFYSGPGFHRVDADRHPDVISSELLDIAARVEVCAGI